MAPAEMIICCNCEHLRWGGQCWVDGVDEFKYDNIDGRKFITCKSARHRNKSLDCKYFKPKPPTPTEEPKRTTLESLKKHISDWFG